MDLVFSLLIGAIIGFIAGIAAMGKSCETDTALKLSNIMHAAMLDCVTSKVIIKKTSAWHRNYFLQTHWSKLQAHKS